MTDNTLPSRSHRLEPDSSRKKRGVAIFIRDLLIIFVVALLISFLIKTFLVRSFYIPSGSMENTLLVDDRIIVNQIEPALVPVSRGDARRAKLYYLRGLRGKKAKIKEKRD